MTETGAPRDLAAFFDEAPCGFVATSIDGLIQHANRTFLTMCGFALEDLVGRRRLSSLLTAGGRIYVETHLAPMLLASGHLREIALEVVDANGRRVPVLLSATLVQDDDGRPDGVRYALFDATERRSYERELLAATTRAEESEASARRLVRSLQQSLIPPVVPVVEGLEVAAAYRPAGDGSEVGGDFYDVFPIGADDWIIAVGDVTGKGLDAAAVTALARYTIRAAAVVTADPAGILRTLNDVLRQDGTTSRWCTVVVARVSRQSDGWALDLSHGGHPLGLLVRDGGGAEELGRPGTLLGAFSDPDLHNDHRSLAPGEAVVLYTDGVTEARCDGDFYGEARLRELAHRQRGSANGIVYGILDDVVSAQGGTTSDDIVIVAVRVPG